MPKQSRVRQREESNVVKSKLAVVLTVSNLLASPDARLVAAGSPQDSRLFQNGSFEEVVTGMVPPLPSGWLMERWSHKDEVTVVSDPALAHRGRRCLRIPAPGIYGLRMVCNLPEAWATGAA